MDDFELAAIENMVRSQIAPNAAWRTYDRTTNTPMNRVLDEAERQLTDRFVVYWVDGGFPELFCLSGFSVTPVVWNSRYIEVVAFLRKLFVEDWLSNVRGDLAERACLKVIAELSLRSGNPELAVLAFLKSVVGKGIHVPDSDLIPALEHEPKTAGYMATWFFGLVHELGHSVSHPEELIQSGLLSDKVIEEALEIAVQSQPHFVEMDRWWRDAGGEVDLTGPPRALSTDHLRGEAAADLFATSVLFQSTLDIVREENPGTYEVPENLTDLALEFAWEMALIINIISLIERCTTTAAVGSGLRSSSDSLAAMGLHPTTFFFRVITMRWYLAVAIAALISNTDAPDRERIDRWRKIIDEVSDSLEDAIKEVESALARAMRFVFFPEEREPDLMLSFAEEVSGGDVMTRLEAERFCELADSLGAGGEALETLWSVATGGEVDVRTEGVPYLVPWIKTPSGADRPFGLETRHGHLVFVFLRQDDLYDGFFQISAEALPQGYALETTMIVAPSTEALTRELAARMPAGQRFGVVVEGTDAFSEFMRELANDTIWPDD